MVAAPVVAAPVVAAPVLAAPVLAAPVLAAPAMAAPAMAAPAMAAPVLAAPAMAAPVLAAQTVSHLIFRYQPPLSTLKIPKIPLNNQERKKYCPGGYFLVQAKSIVWKYLLLIFSTVHGSLT